jgi:hypothetical protein
MKPLTYLAVTVAVGLSNVGPNVASHTTQLPPPTYVSSPGIGGAGAFIVPSHVNGVFGAGGPLVGIGGAGAFIPPTAASRRDR